jgi:hypothetical protein
MRISNNPSVMVNFQPDFGAVLAHDPPKCKRFGDQIMRTFNKLARDRTQNRYSLLLIARGRILAPRGTGKVPETGMSFV